MPAARRVRRGTRRYRHATRLDLGVHLQAEVRVALRLGHNEVEEVPLGHERDVGEARLEAAEVGHGNGRLGRSEPQSWRLGVLDAEQLLRQAEFVHDFHRRGVDGVPPEVPQEVAVLLQHEHVDPLAGQQQPQHRPRRTAADDAAGCVLNVAGLSGELLRPGTLPGGLLRVRFHVYVGHVQVSLRPFGFRSPQTPWIVQGSGGSLVDLRRVHP